MPLESVVINSLGSTGFRSKSVVSFSKPKLVPLTPPDVLMAKASVCGFVVKGCKVGASDNVGAKVTITATVGCGIWVGGATCGVVSNGNGVKVKTSTVGSAASAVMKVGVTSKVGAGSVTCGGGGRVKIVSVGTAGVLKFDISSGERVRVGVGLGGGVLLGVKVIVAV